MMYLSALIIPILSYLLQIYPRFFNKYFGVDVWMRMIEADLIRNNHHKIPMGLVKNKFILEGYFSYPPALSWLLSFVPKKVLLKIQGFIAPIFDALHNLVIFFITLQITGKFEIAFIAQVIYSTTPLSILENSYLTPRSLGYLLFTLTFYPLIAYSVTPNLPFLLFSFFSLFICFFSHKFPIQSLFFISIFFSIFEMNPLYILMFFIAMVSALIISRGYYWRILKEHLVNIYYWSKNYQYRFTHQFEDKKKFDIVAIIYFILLKLSPISLLITNLWTIGPLIFLIGSVLNLQIFPINDILLLKLSLWALFFYIFSILVLSIKYLIPIGEGQRYMELALAPTAIVASIIFSSLIKTQYSVFFWVIFILTIIFNISLSIFLQLKVVISDKNRSMTEDMKESFLFINKLKIKPRVLCFPQQIAHMVAYNIKGKVLVDFQHTTAVKIAHIYPKLKKPIREIAKEFNLNLLILQKHFMSPRQLGLFPKQLIFENAEVQVFKI